VDRLGKFSFHQRRTRSAQFLKRYPAHAIDIGIKTSYQKSVRYADSDILQRLERNWRTVGDERAIESAKSSTDRKCGPT
jgi:hypothetical protein